MPAKKRAATAETGAAEKKAKTQTEEQHVDAMHPELIAKLNEYRKARGFDAKDWIQKKCTMFNDYMRKCGLKACSISVSGGVDSAVMTALCKHASEMKDSPIEKVVAVSQPINSSAWALNRAKECCDALGVEMIVVDQSKIFKDLTELVDKAAGVTGGTFATGQMRSYMRTPVGYYVCQLMSQQGTPCVVMGTGNMDEDGYLLYFCKAGDGVVDIQLIADLHKSEVFAVGAELKVVDSILKAAPSADLWGGQTDEGELGFPYDFVELFTGSFLKLDEAAQKAFVDSLSADAAAQFADWRKKAETVHRRNSHKEGGAKNLNIL